MQHAPREGIPTPAPAQDPGAIVEEFLRLLTIPAPAEAGRPVPDRLAIRFTGGRALRRPADCAAFNAERYAWVKQRFERTDVARGATDAEAAVCDTGTLHGAWSDGTPFEDARCIDRHRVRHGRIVEMDAWNGSVEWRPVRAGPAAPRRSPMQPAAAEGA